MFWNLKASLRSRTVLLLTIAGGGHLLACSSDEEGILPPGTAPVASVTVQPSTATIAVGGTVDLDATLRDSDGNFLTGRSVTWSSEAPGVASVNSSGLVTGQAVGDATVTATSEGETGTADITVQDGPPPPPPGSGDIAVDGSQKFQTMTGWEATAQAGQAEFAQLFPTYRDELFDMAVNDLGINRLRVEIRSGMENTTDWFSLFLNGQISFQEYASHWYEIINDNGDPNVIDSSGFQWAGLEHTMDNVVLPMKQRIEANGEQLFVNLNYVDFSDAPGSNIEHYAEPAEYGEIVLAAFQHLQSQYGFVPDALEIILEPGGGWSATNVGQALAAAASRLQAAGFNPDFIAPSTVSMVSAPGFFDTMIQVPGVLNNLTTFSYHRYGVTSLDALQGIANRAAQNGLRTAMLEHIASGHEDLHEDLKIGNNSAWQQFALAFPEGGDDGTKYFPVNANTGEVSFGNLTRFLRQYFKYVRTGARRVEVTSQISSLDPVAFINADGKYAVVVKADAGVAFTVSGIPAGTYGRNYTTGGAFAVDAGDVTIGDGESVTASIPDAGVITIFGK